MAVCRVRPEHWIAGALLALAWLNAVAMWMGY